MFNLIIASAGLVFGTITDIDHREVPDFVNFSMLAIGLAIGLTVSLAQSTVWPFLFSLAGAALGYLLGAAMYYTGQWGGGDAKMMIGMGALLGLPFTQLSLTRPSFLILFFIASIFVGAAYGLLWMLLLVIKNRKTFFPALAEKLGEYQKLRYSLMIAFAVFLLLAILSLNIIVIALACIAAIALMTFYLFLATKLIEKTCFVRTAKIGELVEGDWLLEPVKKGKKVILEVPKEGLSKKHIKLLKKEKITSVKVKDGIPFVPSFLIAFVLSYLWLQQGTGLLIWL